MNKFKIWYEKYKASDSPYKKFLGVVLIILGLTALVTPFTPGSWLVFFGLELLGFRLAIWGKIKKLIFHEQARNLMLKKIAIGLLIFLVIIAALLLEIQNFKTKKSPKNSEPQVNALEAIQVTFPHPNEYITSPLTITGKARGTWFFEASFPVILTNWDGLIIGQGIAQAQGEWMTENFVPFTAVINFSKPEYKTNGFLILKKDNPSGLPEFDQSIEIPIFFK